jgi:hypothetical protein
MVLEQRHAATYDETTELEFQEQTAEQSYKIGFLECHYYTILSEVMHYIHYFYLI